MSLLARIPSLEVLARLAYWRIPVLRGVADRARKFLVTRKRSKPSGPLAWEDVLEVLRGWGVGEGDIVIVHSSYGVMKRSERSPQQIIDGLLKLIGPNGTLAMPAIPVVRHEPQGSDKFRDTAYDRVFDYDPASNHIATGALPRAMMEIAGAVRSLHPGNSMIAVGAEAKPMMRDNLSRPEPTPCGVGSSWHYSYLQNAKIIALGVDMVHTLTMIHVAEDAFEWPVAGWYRRRRFNVKGHREITIRERKHSWSQFYPERAFARDLAQAGIMRSREIDGASISFCESRALIDFLRAHPRPGYPYYFPLGFRRA